MVGEYSYKELLEKENQRAIRERLLEINKKSGMSIASIAKGIDISQNTLRRFLIEEKEANFSVISKILGWVEVKERELNKQEKNK